ncbi:MAG: ABC transporter ATP-binding protein [Candidatus Bipolaricaulota bacterium]|nr:ABC transporter ATP-binding protein [Candidatus Bipolaricaulota bacterium]MBS3792034.1 ABC transporter ATP-binding protein [Candidatus Bipolaricaulota bacterium]
MGIDVSNLSKNYGAEVVLKGLNLSIPDNSFTSIVAPTGAGKTTLLRVMAGVEKPTEGKVYYDGEDVTDVPVQNRKISMVYQQFINYPSLTLYENIASPLRVSEENFSEEEIDARVQEVAELLNIRDLLDHLPEEASGGEKQRTAIARALIKEPQFTFLDEPLANLDYKLREELRGQFQLIFQEEQSTFIYATPAPEDALSMSSHIGFLHDKNILQFGESEEVYYHPGYVEVGSYLNEPQMNVLNAELIEEEGTKCFRVSDELQVEAFDQEKLETGRSYLLGIRPQDLEIGELEGSVTFDTVVSFNEIVGSTTTLHSDHQGQEIIIFVPEPKRRPEGERLTISLDPQLIYVFDQETSEIVTQGSRTTLGEKK